MCIRCVCVCFGVLYVSVCAYMYVFINHCVYVCVGVYACMCVILCVCLCLSCVCVRVPYCVFWCVSVYSIVCLCVCQRDILEHAPKCIFLGANFTPVKPLIKHRRLYGVEELSCGVCVCVFYKKNVQSFRFVSLTKKNTRLLHRKMQITHTHAYKLGRHFRETFD